MEVAEALPTTSAPTDAHDDTEVFFVFLLLSCRLVAAVWKFAAQVERFMAVCSQQSSRSITALTQCCIMKHSRALLTWWRGLCEKVQIDLYSTFFFFLFQIQNKSASQLKSCFNTTCFNSTLS